MGMWIGRNRKARVCYGFDEISLVPGEVTINPEEVDTSFEITHPSGKTIKLKIPILASAMDGVTDPRFCIEMSRLGGIGVINLEGIQTRYENPQEVINEIIKCDQNKVTELLQKIYSAPVKEKLIVARIEELKKGNAIAAVSSIPQTAETYGYIAQEAGADLYIVQSTVSTVRHISTRYKTLDLKQFCKNMRIPVLVGNAVTYNVVLELMDCGVSGVLIGVGPGAACTSRGVLGIGVPQVTATVDAAAARDAYYKKTGRYVPIITDGGMRRGGDLCKAIACGSDAVMIGSAFARAEEAPGKGCHWGMATPHANLPRGTLIRMGISGPLSQILYGPATVDDGSQNLVGALATSMGNVGAATIKQFQEAEIIIAPSIQSEGKLFQMIQSVGMGR
ncbi:GuaB3 family IMP dehydrogenase-related protein [Candidatus Methylacidiphilum fumarolicum]|uniref:IMP dehydrogenase/GMP reductase n=2 Tax=Candidatus Methylacidiphilum fumarolicum TaxID=591154 RepID=I0JVU6_METFB|nr:GuaB3 family IMP dehydrogenase-related protein [Candidatus Methylacidiphilum fumarolicum]CCG91365.1 IMP dehydrogenase/GMP reductase [Methylacidiphilum fumariolicum SolV]MBW6414113.1 GuaB3 family IMP dehydrogenase-related protein [Candidatus Methylacidiphilum fumarolicum]TFE66460.1 inosine 5-monophosphate dehydrogenase [Candidatus Methylacidiphilum fumarolicum]TFE75203.1 GuaB3 family IMP dehydrogenase-related protein [Candidatus Methylacidiphilum fumarolicum]TFE76186.1 GuaB3 family IMP dehyd